MYRYRVATIEIPSAHHNGHGKAVELHNRIRWLIEWKAVPAMEVFMCTVLLEDQVSEEPSGAA